MKKPYVTVKKLYDRFGGEFLNFNNVNINKHIYSPSLSRLGMELNESFFYPKIISVVVWGNSESRFLDTFSVIERNKRIGKILQASPPLIVLSKNFIHLELLMQINESLNTRVAIIKTSLTTIEITSIIGPWLARKLANWIMIHGTLINVFGEGVLITGSAGIGKSEVAMELVKSNHMFVGDDSIDVAVIGNNVVGKPSKLVADFIEVRGLGILNIKRMFGIQKIMHLSNINLVIELMSLEEIKNEKIQIERIGRTLRKKQLLNLQIPHYIIPVTLGRKISDIIESAVIDFKLNEYEKYNAGIDLNKKIVSLNCCDEEEN